jgi:choline dehydrogenase-like flavoprotein
VHPIGIARMGSIDDELAVVDQHGRIHGTSNLRLADASIMPTVPSANTNLSCIMIGE